MAGLLGTGWRLSAPRLLGPVDVRRLADSLGIRPTKKRGQNFVIDANTVRRIVSAAGVGLDDVVLEVGPGLGSLTLGLLGTGAPVIAVEIDAALAGGLEATVTDHAPDHVARLTVVHGDAMNAALPGEPTLLVANLPYNVAVPVLLQLWADQPTVRRALVMVQLEVAERLAAPPGSRVYGVPSVKVAWYADVRLAGSIGRQVFWPVPNVDSALVAMDRRPPPPSVAGRERVFEVVDAAFGQRRKMLRSSLAGLAAPGAVGQALEAAGVDPTDRPEQISVEAFARITDALHAST